jgi:hypothetical protein
MDLVGEIRKALDTAADYFTTNPYNSTGWTAQVHGRVGDLASAYAASFGMGCGAETGSSIRGKRLVVHIAGQTPPAVAGQFLFDQCWLMCCDNTADLATHGYTTRCVLAMETEWLQNYDEINYDFLKLVLANADNKIFVCWARNEDFLKEVVRQLERQITLFERNTEGPETYLFSVFYDSHFRHFAKAGAGIVTPLH